MIFQILGANLAAKPSKHRLKRVVCIVTNPGPVFSMTQSIVHCKIRTQAFGQVAGYIKTRSVFVECRIRDGSGLIERRKRKTNSSLFVTACNGNGIVELVTGYKKVLYIIGLRAPLGRLAAII